jgi:hypothetical protein
MAPVGGNAGRTWRGTLMGKTLVAVAVALAALYCSSAQAMTIPMAGARPAVGEITRVWDNCGVGRHRTAWGQCVSNYANGPGVRGCPPGYHWGDYTHACFPN